MYLTLVVTEQEDLVNSLFDKESEFLVSLSSIEANEDDRKYLRNFIDFLDPFNSEASINPLLSYLLKGNHDSC